MNFDDVIGQEDIKDLLKRQMAEWHVPHAQLFCGRSGVGKLPMALAFATALLCKCRNADGSPCGTCRDCRMAKGFAHPDMHFVFPIFKRKGAPAGEDPVCDSYLKEWRTLLCETAYFDRMTWLSRIGVENQQSRIYAREADQMAYKLSLTSSQGGYKVMIIWLAEQMNETAANKLLKLLEEPPGETVFILTSEHPEALLPTVLSRVQRIDFKPLPQEVIAQALVERNALQKPDAERIAKLSEGSYIKALSQLRINEDAELFFDMFVLLMRQCYQRGIKELNEWALQVSSWGREKQKDFLQYCQHMVRENFAYNFNLPQLVYMDDRERDFAVRFARFINERNVVGIMREFAHAQNCVEGNVNAKMTFFDLTLKITVLLVK